MVKKMELVRNLDEINENTKTIDGYLNDSDLKEYAFSLIKRGTCFVAVKNNKSFRFYPSRFIGYTANTKHLHSSNSEKDGRVTNNTISGILGKKPVVSEDMDMEYCRFCEKLGFVANLKGAFGVERKFWIV